MDEKIINWSERNDTTSNGQWLGTDEHGFLVATITGGCADSNFYPRLSVTITPREDDNLTASSLGLLVLVQPRVSFDSVQEAMDWCEEVALKYGVEPL